MSPVSAARKKSSRKKVAVALYLLRRSQTAKRRTETHAQNAKADIICLIMPAWLVRQTRRVREHPASFAKAGITDPATNVFPVHRRFPTAQAVRFPVPR